MHDMSTLHCTLCKKQHYLLILNVFLGTYYQLLNVCYKECNKALLRCFIFIKDTLSGSGTPLPPPEGANCSSDQPERPLLQLISLISQHTWHWISSSRLKVGFRNPQCWFIVSFALFLLPAQTFLPTRLLDDSPTWTVYLRGFWVAFLSPRKWFFCFFFSFTFCFPSWWVFFCWSLDSVWVYFSLLASALGFHLSPINSPFSCTYSRLRLGAHFEL